MCEHSVDYLDVVNYVSLSKTGTTALRCRKCGASLVPEAKWVQRLKALTNLRVGLMVAVLCLYLFLRFPVWLFIALLVLCCVPDFMGKYLIWKKLTFTENDSLY